MRQRVVNVSCGDGGVAGADRNLVKIGDDITDRVEAIDCGLLMRVDLQLTPTEHSSFKQSKPQANDMHCADAMAAAPNRYNWKCAPGTNVPAAHCCGTRNIFSPAGSAR